MDEFWVDNLLPREAYHTITCTDQAGVKSSSNCLNERGLSLYQVLIFIKGVNLFYCLSLALL